ncbi:MAG: glycosyltransferase family 9 protein, partial [bacterium]|nr:glycosyltransferase family 9 protein [bacterium]
PIFLQYPRMSIVQDNAALAKFGLEAGKFIVVHLFAGNAGRGLHPDKKRELLTALTKKFPHTRLVITGSANDREEALRVAKGTGATIIAGEATLQELMNLIAESCNVISVDTGVAHITAQLGKPLTVLCTCLGANWWLSEQYGPDAPIRVFSRSERCTQGHVYKDYPDCINKIDTEEIA